MKKLSIICIVTLVMLSAVAAASAGGNWQIDHDGKKHLMFTVADLRIRSSVGELSLGFLCEEGKQSPLRILLIGNQFSGTGQLEYSIQVDGGEIFQDFSSWDGHNGVLVGTPVLGRIIAQFKRGNTALIAAMDANENVSVFELSLAGFSQTFNQTIPQHCLK